LGYNCQLMMEMKMKMEETQSKLTSL